MSGNAMRFLPKSLMKSLDELLRAEMCLLWSTAVSHKYDLYKSPIQQSRDLMKSAFIPALSSKTTAHTLIVCDVNHIISSLVRSGWLLYGILWYPGGWQRCPLVGHQIDPCILLVKRSDMPYAPDIYLDACCPQQKLLIDHSDGSFEFRRLASSLQVDLPGHQESVPLSNVLSCCRNSNPKKQMF